MSHLLLNKRVAPMISCSQADSAGSAQRRSFGGRLKVSTSPPRVWLEISTLNIKLDAHLVYKPFKIYLVRQANRITTNMIL